MACAQVEDAVIIVPDRRVIAHWSMVSSDMFPYGTTKENSECPTGSKTTLDVFTDLSHTYIVLGSFVTAFAGLAFE